MLRVSTTIILLATVFVSFGQTPVFEGNRRKQERRDALSEQFKSYEIFQVPIAGMAAHVATGGGQAEFILRLGDREWEVRLEPSLAGSYVRSLQTAAGVIQERVTRQIAYRGDLVGQADGTVSLTLTEDFLYGYIREGDEHFFLEPLWYFTPGAPTDHLVVYRASDVRPRTGKTCGLDELQAHTPDRKDIHTEAQPGAKQMGCKEIELAIASDRSMHIKYGSVTAVENHNIAVMNNVQNNYDDEFNDELDFEIVEQFIVVPPANDPWSSSTNAATVLSSFTAWGPSGFSEVHDLGQMWTNRDFQGGTIGIAWLSAVCTSNRYHCLQDFSTNANLLRVMTTHEIGHNFSATHDPAGSNTIMAPSVNNTNTWSTQSQNEINGYYPTRGCLANCSPGQPPAAGFSANPPVGCAPLSVTYTDQSTNNPTSWSWSFPGAVPSSSAQQNPTVSYLVPGSYNATLVATNAAGSSTLSQTGVVEVLGLPTSSFSFTTIGLTVIFTNTSTGNATSWFWDFGDGQTSTEQNPIHTYATDGFYNVTLTASSPCGGTPTTLVLPVFTPPSAAFSANPQTGCAGMTVSFTSLSSSNSTGWLWSFPGGTPASSTQENPIVTYTTPGVYNVTLTVSNPAGSNTASQQNYIQVGTIPVPNFAYGINGQTVSFVNTSTGATGYSWDFGDGQTGNQSDPVHTYTANGIYTVTLTATNDCGPAQITQTVEILLPPTATFSASVTEGCAPLAVTFDASGSENATGFAWTFPGGDPATSQAATPTVLYTTAGSYDVLLVVSNSAGADSLLLEDHVTVFPQAVPQFSAAVNGLTAVFSNQSQFASSYAWDFGDGATSSAEQPTHTYAADGTYTVTLSATNDCGTVSATQSVVIVTPPTSGFAAESQSGCAPFTVQFNNTSSENATGFQWSFPGGNPATSTEENPVVTYGQPGTYDVTLTVTNAAGTSTVEEAGYIVVAGPPTPGFSSTPQQATVIFTNTSVQANTYLWDFGDGTTGTETSPVHTYAGDGTYTVTLSATNDCGTAVLTGTVVVVTPPAPGFTVNLSEGCAPLTVQFNNTSSENSTAFAWEFPGGDPSVSTQENPVVTYSEPGNYAVTLTATNAAGSVSVTQSEVVVVGTVPAAAFLSAADILTVSFTNSTVGANTYTWDFGDGGGSTDPDPVHTYAQEGTYTVTLTATNECGPATFTQTVTVIAPPTAAFTSTPANGCAPLTVQFDNTSSENATAFLWAFPGGVPASSTEENPVVVYDQPGTYDVTLTAYNSSGEQTVSEAGHVVVLGLPVPSFTGAADGLVLSLQAGGTNATEYQWDFGDGQTGDGPNPVHTYASDGTYLVTLTAVNECGPASTSQSFTLVTPPTAGFTAGVSAGCTPLTVAFQNNSTANATTFQWSFPGGTPATSTEAAPTVTYTQAGTFAVTLVAGNAAGSDTLTLADQVVVKPLPTALAGGEIDGSTVAFLNLSLQAASFSWDFGDGNGSTEPDPVHTYAADGVYTIVLTATNDCGSDDFTMIAVIATEGPIAAFAAEATEGCAPFTVQFDNLSSANTESFEWSFPGGDPATSTEADPVVTYAEAGTYDVSLTAYNAQGQNTAVQTGYVTVGDVPVASFTYAVEPGGMVTFTNGSVDADSFVWDFGDGETSDEKSPTHSYTQGGEYTVTLTAVNGCGFSTLSATVTIVVSGTADRRDGLSMAVYPNPAGSRCQVVVQGDRAEPVEVRVTDLLGRTMYRGSGRLAGTLTFAVPVEDLASGSYLVEVRAGGTRRLVERLVVIREQ